VARDGGPGRGARAYYSSSASPGVEAGRTPLPEQGLDVSRRFDDELPERIPLPRPGGWFEVFCCGTLLVLLIGAVLLVALLTR
jgi:hypothetical protein